MSPNRINAIALFSAIINQHLVSGWTTEPGHDLAAAWTCSERSTTWHIALAKREEDCTNGGSGDWQKELWAVGNRLWAIG
jgi:hypothetical protein